MAPLPLNFFRRVSPLAVAIALGLVASCAREDRDFANGGPRHVTASEFQPSGEPKPARGPQTRFEENAYALSEGKRHYRNFNCIGCHANGGGDIGPALMDARWLYGAAPAEVFSSIMDGRPNGMPAFRGRITETQGRQLAAYVRSLSGQANPNAGSSREEHMRTSPGESSLDRLTPERDQPQHSSPFKK